ncbi:phosphatase PAP2 family protein [Jiulongibacter sp. NS-SX5]|uniref:phosphatase PAP2 family protein n=1 Tax=Jiulongibacter sp. NS-SX5 TaxID=3463854 RepID=UPI004059A8AF
MEQLIQLDVELFRYLNGLHTPFFDGIMAWVTSSRTWISLYLLIVFFLFKNFGWKTGGIFFLFLAFSAGLADHITSGIMKPAFERLRPCQNPELTEWLHLVGRCGGRYGFASSHASNTFSLACGLSLIYASKRWLVIGVFLWAIIVSYSRIYVGVHYPGDVITGALIGIFISLLLYYILVTTTKPKTL